MVKLKKMLPVSFGTVVYRPEWMRVETACPSVFPRVLSPKLPKVRRPYLVSCRTREAVIFPRIHGTNVDKYLNWELHISVGSAFTLRTFPITERTTSETVNNETFIALLCKLCTDADQHHSHTRRMNESLIINCFKRGSIYKNTKHVYTIIFYFMRNIC